MNTQALQNPSDPSSDTVRHLDDLIQQLLRNHHVLSTLLDQVDDPLEYARVSAIHSRNALRLARLCLDRHTLTATTDPFTETLNQALDQLSVDLGINL